jgi:hypothetical protein
VTAVKYFFRLTTIIFPGGITSGKNVTEWVKVVGAAAIARRVVFS